MTIEVRPEGELATVPEQGVTIRPTPRPVIHARRIARAAPAKTGTLLGWLHRTLLTIYLGFKSWTLRTWGAFTFERHKRTIDALYQSGQHDAAVRAQDSLTKAKAERRANLLGLPKQVLMTSAVLGIILGVLLTLDAIIGGVVQIIPNTSPDDWDFKSWMRFNLDVLLWVAWVIEWAAILGAIVALPAMLRAAWCEGKRARNKATFQTGRPLSATGAAITPDKILIALRDLGISKLTKQIETAVANGTAGGRLSEIRKVGCGTEFDYRPDTGVSTEEILKSRRKMAENLDRHEHELYMTVPAARTIRFWAADPGELDKPISPSPLVLDPSLRADIYHGRAPWGVTMRGDPAWISLHQRHVLITGLSNTGKTYVLRELALWAAHDVTAELRIADLKGLSDWHMFTGIATTLIEGPADAHVIAATEMLEAAVAEMERRTATLDKDKYPNGVTRDLARQPGSGFHPLIIIVDEAQKAFMCPAVGKDKRPYGGTKATSRYFNAAREIHNQGRAVNVMLWQGTQDPTDQNLPKLVREGAHIRGGLALGTVEQSVMAIGEQAVNAGGAPHLLRADIDKGTLVLNGDGFKMEPGQQFITVRTYLIDGDAATEMAKRIRELRAEVRFTPPQPRTAYAEQVRPQTATIEVDQPEAQVIELRPAPAISAAPTADYSALEAYLERPGSDFRTCAEMQRELGLSPRELTELMGGLGLERTRKYLGPNNRLWGFHVRDVLDAIRDVERDVERDDA